MPRSSRRSLAALLLAGLAAATPAVTSAGAATRGYSVTSFSRLELSGPYKVVVRIGPGPSAIATGDAQALDKLVVAVRGERLVIASERLNWTGGADGGRTGKVSIAVTVPTLAGAIVAGSGSIAIDRLRGDRFLGLVNGAGALDIGQSEIDRLTLGVNGAGAVSVAGKCAQAVLSVQGAGAVKADALRCQDVQLVSQGSGAITAAADRSAKVNAAGSGDVTVTGNAACTVTANGSGNVLCGREAR